MNTIQVEQLAHLTFGGRYEMVKPAAAKTHMAIVYQAWDREINRTVAVKFLLPQHATNADMFQRFHHEAEIASGLQHPHIVGVTDFNLTSEHGMPAYLVMPWLPGEPLSARIEGGYYRNYPLSNLLHEADAVADKIGSALDYVHKKGIVHRDIKPSNIILFKNEPYLIDFGIAGQTNHRYTDTVGTPRYIAPETLHRVCIDGRADQYALALVLYELLVGGQSPYTEGETSDAWYERHLQDAPRPLREKRRDLPAAFEPIFQRALNKQPDARYPDMATFTQALHTVCQAQSANVTPSNIKPVEVKPISVMRAARSTSKASPTVVGWLGIILMIISAFAILALGLLLLSLLTQ